MSDNFKGYTNADGTRVHNSPAAWPFATLGPMTAMASRYAPLDDGFPKEVAIKPTPAASIFASMAAALSLTPKVKK